MAVAACLASMAGVFLPSPAVGSSARAADAAASVIATYQQRIPQLMAEQHIPGLAVALVDGNRVLWTQGFGHVDGSGSAPVTPATIFNVQSMSKLFTATAQLAVWHLIGWGLT